jgi:hypothetical protein
LALDAVRTYPLASRRSKVQQADFARPHRRGGTFASFLAGLPRILAGGTLRSLCDAILSARARGRPVVWGLGAHVIKVGLSPVLIDLMERGFVTGSRAERRRHRPRLRARAHRPDLGGRRGRPRQGRVRHGARDGRRARPRGRRGRPEGLGLGAAIGRYLARRRPRPRHLKLSLLAAAHRLGLPATVHVAVGTDIVHVHPACDPARSAARPTSTSACSPRRSRVSAEAAST